MLFVVLNEHSAAFVFFGMYLGLGHVHPFGILEMA